MEPGHSTEECKILKDYYAKYAVQRPHNKRQSHSGGNKKRVMTFKFYGAIEEVNSMTDHDAHIPRKTRGEIRQRSLRVTRELHLQNRRNVLMGLTA